jgi:Site-specific recombinase XerD
MKFHNFYKAFVKNYKEGMIQPITLKKYYITHKWIKENFPDLEVEKIRRIDYQKMLNKYAETHSKQTVVDFHHHVKSAIKDALYEGRIKKDPTYRVALGGMKPPKRNKFLERDELEKLLNSLELKYLGFGVGIYLTAKTGLRFAELLGLTYEDINFEKNTISVNKTYDYKNSKLKRSKYDVREAAPETLEKIYLREHYMQRFKGTKNSSSVREIKIDRATAEILKRWENSITPTVSIFARVALADSTWNENLKKYCQLAGIKEITMHSLRHTHISVLASSGISMMSISKRAGHANTLVTQKVYTHLLKEQENKDDELILHEMEGL